MALAARAASGQYKKSVDVNSGRGVVDVTSLTTVAAAAAADEFKRCSRAAGHQHGAGAAAAATLKVVADSASPTDGVVLLETQERSSCRCPFVVADEAR